MNRLPLAMVLAVLVFSGRVLDRTTGQGLPHVIVAVGSARVTTDADGRFSIRNVKPGLTSVTLKSNDVPTQHYAIRLGTGITHHDFRACSTTLDYSCGTPALHDSGEGGSAG